MSSSLWSRLQRLRHDLLDLLVADLARGSWPRFIVQTFHSLRDKATSPLAHRGPHRVHLFRNFYIRQSRRAMKHELGPESLVRRTTTASTQLLERLAFFRRELQFGFAPTHIIHALRRSQESLFCPAFSVPGH